MKLFPTVPLQEAFKEPPMPFRGAPLWSWNCTLDRRQLLEQIGQMHRMGLGGFHIHPRTGLGTEYLGEEFMGYVRACAEKAKELGMRCYLYDEDRWPSGAAGGLVTEDPAFATHYLLWTRTPYCGQTQEPSRILSTIANRNENGVLLGAYRVRLQDGCLAEAKRLEEEEARSLAAARKPVDGVWFAYMEHSVGMPWWNDRPYVDTLNPKAIRKFIQLTHERYKECIGDLFGDLVPSIFTDEPQFFHKQTLARPEDGSDRYFPWTPDLRETFSSAYGEDPLDRLPELFWDLPDRAPSLMRYRFHDHVCERFATAFSDQLGQWCEENGLLLTGHMMFEETLDLQTRALGDAMRSYRSFQLPGIDILCDTIQLNTAKQAQSVSRQYGREGVMSELYGVTNWDFDFPGHKRQGDWQAALGITLRVHHLTWVSMAGEAKRDYPACIGYQSPWYEEYPVVENHFARVNLAMTRGEPVCRVAVVHPIESFWLAWGPNTLNATERQEREANFEKLTEWLLYGGIDFDFLCEALLPEQAEGAPGGALQVGKMSYDVVVVPGMRTIRSTTLDVLEQWGGRVVFAGEIPSLVDAQPSDRAQRLAERSSNTPLSRGRLLAALAPFRELELQNAHGSPADSILHQLREEKDGTRYLFLCNTDRDRPRSGVKIILKGEWAPTLLETTTGDTRPLAAAYEGGQTVMVHDFPAHGSLLFELRPGMSEVQAPARPVWREVTRLNGRWRVTLSEPNVLLLDQARYRISGPDGEEITPWTGPEEVLRIENILREKVGIGPNDGNIPQPWADREPLTTLATVDLEFAFLCEHPVENPVLALEDPLQTNISLDGQVVDVGRCSAEGFFVDESIRLVQLPKLAEGEHRIRLTIPFHRRRAIEWCYLLGDFGVRIEGRRGVITEPVRDLSWGDWCHQGLPFYAGNVTYHVPLPEEARAGMKLRFPQFKAPLLKVTQASREQPVAFAPFDAELKGESELEITAYGNRINAFGPVHCSDRFLTWFGPGAWRTEGERYSYEYQLKPMGVLVAPILYQRT